MHICEVSGIIFYDNNRIIDQDPERKNQCKQSNSIDIQTCNKGNNKDDTENHWDTKSGIKSIFKTKEYYENSEHYQDTHK